MKPSKTAGNLKKYKGMVEFVLMKYDHPGGPRDDDIELTITVWQEFYEVGDSISLKQLHDIPRELTLVKLRQVVQNTEYRYLPTNLKIARKRGIEEATYRDYMVRQKEQAEKKQTVQATSLFGEDEYKVKPERRVYF